MGGSSGGPTRIGDVRGLIERAKRELTGKRNVFISFAHENLNEVNLLRGQAKSEKSPIEFNDWSVSEPYDSERAAYIKQRISDRISQSSVTVVYMTPESAGSNWVNWEINRSLELGKKVLAVYKGNVKPNINFPAISDNDIKCVPWKTLASAIESLD